jgi:Domain of unknown function (DUF4376)
MAGLWVTSKVEVSPNADIPALVAAAGGNTENARYDNGVLIVRGVEQADLDAALAAGVDETYAQRGAKLTALDGVLQGHRDLGMPWSGKVLQIHEEALSDINRMVTASMAGLLPANFAWRMKDNTFLALDSNGMMAMGAAALGRTYALYAHYWSKKDAILAAPDEQALDAINVETGWPVPTTT